MPEPITIATWPFGKLAVETAMKLLARGEPALDAALAGAQAVEDDTSIRNSVGFGSLPDRIGRLTLDACLMDGRTLACGAVACVEHIRHPAALARRVMEKTPHVLLVGEAAKWFALQQGFPLEVPYTAESIKEWLDKHPDAPKEKPSNAPARAAPPDERDGASDININQFNHDTVTVLSLDKKGHLGGVCTTSGLAYKLPGRVGDSPIIGAGLYVDDLAGAAGGTGVGEEIIRIGASLFITEQMRAGKSPQEACELACKRANAAAGRRGVHPAPVAFLALDPKGNVGAACTEKANFKYAVGRGDKVELLTAKEVGPARRKFQNSKTNIKNKNRISSALERKLVGLASEDANGSAPVVVPPRTGSRSNRPIRDSAGDLSNGLVAVIIMSIGAYIPSDRLLSATGEIGVQRRNGRKPETGCNRVKCEGGPQ